MVDCHTTLAPEGLPANYLSMDSSLSIFLNYSAILYDIQIEDLRILNMKYCFDCFLEAKLLDIFLNCEEI